MITTAKAKRTWLRMKFWVSHGTCPSEFGKVSEDLLDAVGMAF